MSHPSSAKRAFSPQKMQTNRPAYQQNSRRLTMSNNRHSSMISTHKGNLMPASCRSAPVRKQRQGRGKQLAIEHVIEQIAQNKQNQQSIAQQTSSRLNAVRAVQMPHTMQQNPIPRLYRSQSHAALVAQLPKGQTLRSSTRVPMEHKASTYPSIPKRVHSTSKQVVKDRRSSLPAPQARMKQQLVHAKTKTLGQSPPMRKQSARLTRTQSMDTPRSRFITKQETVRKACSTGTPNPTPAHTRYRLKVPQARMKERFVRTRAKAAQENSPPTPKQDPYSNGTQSADTPRNHFVTQQETARKACSTGTPNPTPAHTRYRLKVPQARMKERFVRTQAKAAQEQSTYIPKQGACSTGTQSADTPRNHFVTQQETTQKVCSTGTPNPTPAHTRYRLKVPQARMKERFVRTQVKVMQEKPTFTSKQNACSNGTPSTDAPRNHFVTKQETTQKACSTGTQNVSTVAPRKLVRAKHLQNFAKCKGKQAENKVLDTVTGQGKPLGADSTAVDSATSSMVRCSYRFTKRAVIVTARGTRTALRMKRAVRHWAMHRYKIKDIGFGHKLRQHLKYRAKEVLQASAWRIKDKAGRFVVDTVTGARVQAQTADSTAVNRSTQKIVEKTVRYGMIKPAKWTVKYGSKAVARTVRKGVEVARRRKKSKQYSKRSRAAGIKKMKLARAQQALGKKTAKAMFTKTKTIANALRLAFAKLALAVKSKALLVAALIVLILCGMMAPISIIASAVGVLFCDENAQSLHDSSIHTMQQAYIAAQSDWHDKIKLKHKDDTYDRIDYVSALEDTTQVFADPAEVIAVFAVKVTSKDKQDAMTLDEKKRKILKEVYATMHSYTSKIVKEKKDQNSYRNVLVVTITPMTAEQAAEHYRFNREDKQALDELLSEYRADLTAMVSGGQFGGVGGSVVYPGAPIEGQEYTALMDEATKHIGKAYVYGGSTPAGFDCSGFVCYVYTKSGVYNLPRTTAQGIYNQCAPVSSADAQPGDLVFFQGTYNHYEYITHIGIYVGNNKMLHCGNPIGYADLGSNWWTSHFVGFGRLPSVNETQ